MHNGVPDTEGSGGEFWISGTGHAMQDPSVREMVAAEASYDPAEQYVLFELRMSEARCNGYGDVPLPSHSRWSLPG